VHTQGSICWRECGTRDARAAKAFYCALFGWTAEDQPLPGEGGGAYTVLKLGGKDVAGLYQMEGPAFSGVPPHWAAYLWLDDVDEGVERARALGAEVLGGPFDVEGVGRIAVLRDPVGAVIQVIHGDEHECAQVTDASPGSFCWSELATTDDERARRFYAEVAGWTPVERETSPGSTYTTFLLDDRPVGGMLRMEGERWRGIAPHWMNYVSVADVDEVGRRARALGGSVLVPPTDVPGVGRYALLADPTGAVFSAIALLPR